VPWKRHNTVGYLAALGISQGTPVATLLTFATRLNMDSFAIITNRKRAIIALVHSVFFLGIAGMQLAVSHTSAFSIHEERRFGGILLLAIYVIVTTVLVVLLLVSHCAKEKLYFAFCAASAGFGLVRILLGDPVLHANVLRVLLLGCAVFTGAIILRKHSASAVAE